MNKNVSFLERNERSHRPLMLYHLMSDFCQGNASLSFFISDSQAKMCIYLVLFYIRICSFFFVHIISNKLNVERFYARAICDLTKIDHLVSVFSLPGDLWLEIAFAHIESTESETDCTIRTVFSILYSNTFTLWTWERHEHRTMLTAKRWSRSIFDS